MASVAPAARDAQLEAAACHESPAATEMKQKEEGPVAHPAGHRQSADPAALYLPAAQGWHAAEELAPGEGEKRPAGQGVALTEDSGQKEPAGHSAGAPEAQKKEAGQGTQASWRTLLLVQSTTSNRVSASTATPTGKEKRAAGPKPSA